MSDLHNYDVNQKRPDETNKAKFVEIYTQGLVKR